MGTLASASSAFYQPFDTILGSHAAVRILRILALHGGLLSANRISLQAQLNRSGVGRVLDQLVEAGIVEREGQGRSLLYRFSDQHPLAAALLHMFQAERERVDHFTESLRTIAADMKPVPVAVWQFGSTARKEDRPESDFDVVVVWQDGPIHHHTDHFAQRLEAAGKRWAVKPSVVDFDIADLQDAHKKVSPFWRNLVRDYRLIFGQRPDEVVHGER